MNLDRRMLMLTAVVAAVATNAGMLPDQWRVSGPPVLPSSINRTTVLQLSGNAKNEAVRQVGWMRNNGMGGPNTAYAYKTPTLIDIDPTYWDDWEWNDVTFDPAVDNPANSKWDASPIIAFLPMMNHRARIMNYSYTSADDFYMDSPHVVLVLP